MPKRLLYVVSEDWYFLSHRLPMARAARNAGFEVHVATRVVQGAAAIQAEGFTLHAIPFVRGTLSPIATLQTIAALRRLHRIVAPAICHHVALQASVLGSLAAVGKRAALVNALTGFGSTFIANDAKTRLLRFLIGGLLRLLFVREGSLALVQNPDDRATLLSMGIPASHIALIPGSGVDTVALTPLPEPPPPVVIGYVGRLLTDKGVPTLVAAHELLARRGRPVALLIAGEPDPANPASIPDTVIAEWTRRPGLTLLGHVDDIRTLWAKAHIAALPSLREGLPLSLLEAAACGRPIVATDVPGCREIARRDLNALLVPPQDADALADAIERLASDADLRRRFGAAGRALVESEFSHQQIGREIVALYDRLLQPIPG